MKYTETQIKFLDYIRIKLGQFHIDTTHAYILNRNGDIINKCEIGDLWTSLDADHLYNTFNPTPEMKETLNLILENESVTVRDCNDEIREVDVSNFNKKS